MKIDGAAPAKGIAMTDAGLRWWKGCLGTLAALVAMFGPSAARAAYYTTIAVDEDLTFVVPTMPRIVDATTGQGLNGVTVTVRECGTCTTYTVTTPSYPTIPGSYMILPPGGLQTSSGNEAVRVDVSRASYLSRTVYQQVAPGGRFYGRSIALYSGAATDTDGDGLPDVQEAALGTNPNSRDTDGDRIPDGWEVNGYDYVDYPSMGANPRKKDIFVEVDWMTGRKPMPEALQDVVDAFAIGPVSNPDGSIGINLHVDLSNEVPRDADLNPAWAEFPPIRNANSNVHRVPVFHYCLFAVQHDGGNSSGVAEVGGTNLMVTLGNSVGSRIQQAGTFMHELGHNLYLRHGGADEINSKPNYLSVMNYNWQQRGLRIDGVNGRIDYSRFQLATLNENNLSEQFGLDVVGSGGSDAAIEHYGTWVWHANVWTQIDLSYRDVDWNRNGVIDTTNVSEDINGDGVKGNLTSMNDWVNLVFDGGGTIGAGGGVDSTTSALTASQPHDSDPCPPPY